MNKIVKMFVVITAVTSLMACVQSASSAYSVDTARSINSSNANKAQANAMNARSCQTDQDCTIVMRYDGCTPKCEYYATSKSAGDGVVFSQISECGTEVENCSVSVNTRTNIVCEQNTCVLKETQTYEGR